MGEAKRRRATVIEQRTFSIDELRKMRHRCGWRDCPESYQGDQPSGWVSLLAYHAPRPIPDVKRIRDWRHDKVLCPKHAKMLDDLLLPTRFEVEGPAAGSA
jgi:hypothetical protein